MTGSADWSIELPVGADVRSTFQHVPVPGAAASLRVVAVRFRGPGPVVARQVRLLGFEIAGLPINLGERGAPLDHFLYPSGVQFGRVVAMHPKSEVAVRMRNDSGRPMKIDVELQLAGR